MFLTDVCQALKKANVDYALVGGYAVALHGAPRGTLDVDIALVWSLENLQAAENTLKALGLQSQLPIQAEMIYQFRDEYIQNRNLVAWNFVDPGNPARQVDIIIIYKLTSGLVMTLKTKHGSVKLLKKDALIQMKRESDRPQDREDIKALEQL